MNPELAQFLLAGHRALRENPTIARWPSKNRGLTEPELLWIITQLTGKEVIEEAIQLLEYYAREQLSPTIPSNLKELVEELEAARQETNEAKQEELLHKVRTFIVAAKLKEQYAAERTAQEQPSPRIPSQPAEQPAVTLPPREEVIPPVPTELYLEISRPIQKGITRTIASLPAQAVRGALSLGQEALGRKEPSTVNALAFAQLGVTAASFQQTADEFQRQNPYAEKSVVSALLAQAHALSQFERGHRLYISLTRTIHPPNTLHLALSPSLPQRVREEKEEKIPRGETLRIVIDRVTQQVNTVERIRLTAAPIPLPSLPAIPAGVQQAVSVRKNIISQVSIWTRKFPFYVGRTLFPQVGKATMQAAVGPGQQLVVGGLRGGFGALGGVGRGTFGFLGRLAGVGGVGGGTTAVGVGAAGVGISGGTAVALVAVAAILVIGALAFFNTSISHQGAYLEQGGLGLAEQNSRFIEVGKNATPSTIATTELPQEVSFEIKVAATQQKLINIQVDNQTTHLGKSGSRPITANLPTYPRELQPGESFVIKYTILATDEFTDSIISDLVIVTADVPDQNLTGEESRATASVTIGTPSTFCFAFDGPWTDEERGMETEAIFTLARSPTFIKALCGESNERTIHLVRRREDTGYGGMFQRPSTITIYNRGLLWSVNATYTLAHEGGHAYVSRFGGVYRQFIDSGVAQQEGFIKSYPLDKSTDEDFAEMIGIYPVWRNLSFRGCGGCFITYPSEYPLHYQFARTNIFGGVEY